MRACIVIRQRPYGILGAARMVKFLGVGVLLMVVRAGAFGVLLQAKSVRRVVHPAKSQASQTSAVTARGGRWVAYLAQQRVYCCLLLSKLSCMIQSMVLAVKFCSA